MILTQMAVRHFRNLSAVELGWNDAFNVIWGRNAQGKTNILEAIYLLGHLKSFRQARGTDLIEQGHASCRLRGDVSHGNVLNHLEINLLNQGRTPRVNSKPVRRMSEFLGYLRSVLFTPEELGVIKGYPAGRRALIDRAILQTDPTYLERAQEYERILRQRNHLLKQQTSAAELQPWSVALIKCGGRLRRDRLVYLERFRPYLRKVYCQISGGQEEVDIRYSIDLKPEEQLRDEIQTDLQRLHARERQWGQTLVGPHRDDLECLVNERSLRLYGSQGQQRSFLLAFKAAQVIDQETELGAPPLLLLDDLASELDTERQAGFIEFLLARRGQVFLTTAYPAVLAEAIQRQASYFKVDCGTVALQSPG